jgi:DNA polymerase III epsilon subunit-like protein
VLEMLHGRTLVAHNVALDCAFLTAEAKIVDTELPIDAVMCTSRLPLKPMVHKLFHAHSPRAGLPSRASATLLHRAR